MQLLVFIIVLVYQFPKPRTNQRAYAFSIMKIIDGGCEVSRLGGSWRKQPRGKIRGCGKRMNFVEEDGLNYIQGQGLSWLAEAVACTQA